MSIHTDREISANHPDIDPDLDRLKAFDGAAPHPDRQEPQTRSTITGVIRENMKWWKTILHLHHDKGMVTFRPIEIKSGIYQGDSLSPLVFCLALAPLSSLRNKSG